MTEKNIDLGSEDSFAVCDNGAYFMVAFDKLFRNPVLEAYNLFSMSSKRNFKNLSELILESYNELFLDDRGELKEECQFLIFSILKAKSDIMTSENGTPYEQFIKQLDTIITGANGLLIKVISDFVEENYALQLDKITEATKNSKRKVNDELQFKDDHAKELLKVAYLYRIMTPLISEYFTYNKDAFNSIKSYDDLETEDGEVQFTEEDLEEMEFDDVNASIFNFLFDKITANPEALRNKLYKLAYSGVSKTSYSDKRFWMAAKSVAVTEKSESFNIYKKLVINAIPKLSIDGDKNIVSFLQSVINNQVDFLFQNKFKNRFVTLGEGVPSAFSTDDNDDAALSEFERLEIQNSRKNEGSHLIRKMNIIEVLEQIPEKMNVGVSDAEVKALMPVLKQNAIQETIVTLLTFKYFKDKSAVKFLTFYQYTKLLICCKKFLLQQKYIYLPMILTATCEKHRERSNIAGRKMKPEILATKKYKDLVAEKYENFADEIEKPIIAIIATVYSSIFKDENGEEIFDSSIKVQKIADELISIIGLI